MSKIVDVHNHAIPVGFIERVRSAGGSYGYEVVPVQDALQPRNDSMYSESSEMLRGPTGALTDLRARRTDEERRVQELAEAGIDICIESLTPNAMLYVGDERQAEWATRAINDGFLENMERFPARVVPAAHVPLHYPSIAAREVERVAALGMKVIQIGSSVNDTNLDDPSLAPFWAAAEEANMVVFVHPAPISAHNSGVKQRLARYHLVNAIGNTFETTTAIASMIFGGVFDRYPGLVFYFAHAGGFAPWIRGRLRHTQKVRAEAQVSGPQRPFDEYFGRLYFDTITHDPEALLHLIITAGPEHVLHGTDYAADMGDWGQVSAIQQMESLSTHEKDLILGENALRLLNLDSDN